MPGYILGEAVEGMMYRYAQVDGIVRILVDAVNMQAVLAVILEELESIQMKSCSPHRDRIDTRMILGKIKRPFSPKPMISGLRGHIGKLEIGNGFFVYSRRSRRITRAAADNQRDYKQHSYGSHRTHLPFELRMPNCTVIAFPHLYLP